MSIRRLTNSLAILHKMLGLITQDAPKAADAVERAAKDMGPQPGTDLWFATMRYKEIDGADGPRDANGRPIEQAPAQSDPLRQLRSAVATVAATQAATQSVQRAQDALDTRVDDFVRFGQEMSESTARYLDALSKKSSVFGVTGEVFLTKFFELLAHEEQARKDNDAFQLGLIHEWIYALVKDIRAWLGKEGEMFDPAQFFSQASLSPRTRARRRSRMTLSRRGSTSAGSTGTGTLP